MSYTVLVGSASFFSHAILIVYGNRLTTLETFCFEILLLSLFSARAAWVWGMVRESFGAVPAMLWLILCGISLFCAATIAALEFFRR
ncbi:MAG TPA: hypothetical protein VMT67_08135 [Terriglobales bacterium]|nr:hypothetical protein [Terriglobales bacterium]